MFSLFRFLSLTTLPKSAWQELVFACSAAAATDVEVLSFLLFLLFLLFLVQAGNGDRPIRLEAEVLVLVLGNKSVAQATLVTSGAGA